MVNPELNVITEAIIGSAIEVHRSLGPGLLESIYQTCLSFELTQRGHRVEEQRQLPIVYKGLKLEGSYRVDMVVDGLVIVELKTVERIEPVHEAQLLTYLKLSGLKLGLLINFNVPVLRQGVRRLAN